MRNTLQKKGTKERSGRYLSYFLLSLPGVLWLLLFHYVPVFGIVLAFKKFNYMDGIFGSQWVGLKNFESFFKSNDWLTVVRNTLGYNIGWALLINVVLGAVVALMLFDITKKAFNKGYQTAMLIPNFISWVAVAYIGYLFLSPTTGILNTLLTALGLEPVSWYNEPKYWPWILTVFNIWKNVGMASLYYYSALLGIDTALFEAAELDGAGKFQRIWHISVPQLTPMICITLITQMGQAMGGSMDIFYQLSMNQGALYPATDTIATYLYRGLVGGSVGTTAAVGLLQNVVGLILLITTNTIVKKINSDQALY